MKKILTICFSVFLLFSSVSCVLAQEQIDSTPTENSNRYFDLKLTKISQSPINKAIQYTLEVVPLVESPKTQIIWEVPLALKAKTKHQEFVALSKGQTYEFDANIIPTKEGTYEIAVEVVSWQYDTNYTNTIGDTLVLNNSLASVPVFSGYQVGRVLLFVLIFVILGLSIFGLIKLKDKLAHKTKKWLTPPT